MEHLEKVYLQTNCNRFSIQAWHDAANDLSLFSANFPKYREMVLEDKELLCGELLSLIAYGIKKEVEKMPDMIWSADKKSFTFQGDHFSLGLFRALVGNLVEEGERLLKECLLSEERDPFAGSSIKESELLQSIKENAAEGTNGYSFLNDHRNTWLQPLRQAAVETIVGSLKLRREALTRSSRVGGIKWKVDFVHTYTRRAEHLLEGEP